MRRTIYHECGGYKARLVDLLMPGYYANNVHLQTAINDSGQLSLTIPPSNPEGVLLGAMASELVIYEDDAELFRGRITAINRDIYGFLSVTAKGVLDYLHDTILQPATYTGTSRKVINDLIYEHASKPIESWKKFTLGTINVPGTITLEIKSPTTTWEAVKQLVEDYGGYISARRIDGSNVIDWVEDITHVCSQPLRIGSNIISSTTELKTSNLCTVMYGFGKNNNGSALNFSSVNDGKKYIVDSDAYSAFGWIEGYYSNSNCEDASQLLEETRRELNDRLEEVKTVTIKASDLADLQDGAERLQAGYLVPCKLSDSDAEQNLRIKELDWYPFEPKKTSMSVGATLRTLSKMIGG